jgi:hypothetical protein
MNTPSKEELKEKYDITEDDFEILDSLPSAGEVQKKESFLVKLGEIAGAQAWMWKSWKGKVIAIVLVYMFVNGVYDTFKPLALWSYEKVPIYLQACQPYAEEIAKGYIAFVQQPTAQQYPAVVPAMDVLPIGTGLFPVSGSMLG